MNTNKSIGRSLESANANMHEASVCLECTPGLNTKQGKWTTVSDMENYDGDIGLVHYFDGRNVMMMPFSHELVIGSTGTGKSEVFYKNQIELLSRLPEHLRPSFLVTDTKGILHLDTGRGLIQNNYNVVVVDMRNPYQSARFNFMLQIYDDYHHARNIKKLLDEDKIGTVFEGKKYPSKTHARNAAKALRVKLTDSVERNISEVASILLDHLISEKDRTWAEGAKTMCRALIWTMLRDSEDERNGMTRDKFTISNLCRIAGSTGEECEEIIEWLEAAKDNLTVRNALASNYKLRAKVTRDGYISTLNTSLGPFAATSIGAITATSDDIDLKEIAGSDRPYAIFVITDERQKTTNTICGIFINSLINELVAAADERAEHALPRDFVILADEFANIPKLPDLAQKITTLRSRRIWMVMAIQSIQQMNMVYSEDISSVIQDNCDLHLFLGCNNDMTKEAFAKSMGLKIGVKTSFTINNEGSVSINKGTENVPVIRKSDLDALTLGQFYVRSRQSENMRSYIVPYFERTDTPKPLVQEDVEFRDHDPEKYIYDIYEVIKLEHRRPQPAGRRFDFDF